MYMYVWHVYYYNIAKFLILLLPHMPIEYGYSTLMLYMYMYMYMYVRCTSETWYVGLCCVLNSQICWS